MEEISPCPCKIYIVVSIMKVPGIVKDNEPGVTPKVSKGNVLIVDLEGPPPAPGWSNEAHARPGQLIVRAALPF